MPITYSNRKGVTYWLCRGTTKTGQPRYFFARELKGEPVQTLPEGFEIAESVNSVVSLVKARPQLIRPDELAAVEAAVKRHPQAGNYRVAVKHTQIIIHERQGPDTESLNAVFGRSGPLPVGLLNVLDRSAQYIPIMRFTLRAPDKREYTVERWNFRGSIDNWIDIGHSGSITALARNLIPLLGTDQFFEPH